MLVCATLLGGADRLRFGEWLIALALLAVCVLTHESHALIVAILLVLAVARFLLTGAKGSTAFRVIGALAGAVLIAAVGQLAFAAAVKHVIGAPPLRPPFLMARMIEDGPGYQYLRASCPRSAFTVCRYLDRLPVDANLFLWDPGPRGVFSAVSPPVRQAIAAEQTRFVLAVLAYAPWVELRDAAGDLGEQLTMTGLQEFQYPDVLKRSFEEKIPLVHLRRLKGSAAYRGTMPVRPFSVLTGVICGLAAIVVLTALLWPPLRSTLPPRLIAVTAWIVIGLIVNSVVCGVLSGPHNRYAARVAWLLPLAAFLIGDAAFERRRRAADAAAASAEPA